LTTILSLVTQPKGGRQATPKDLEQLKGFNEDGVPTGLYKCPACGFYKGTCLDPSPCFQGLKVKVHCRCENNNKCARCGQPLSQFRLNANYYDEKPEVSGMCQALLP